MLEDIWNNIMAEEGWDKMMDKRVREDILGLEPEPTTHSFDVEVVTNTDPDWGLGAYLSSEGDDLRVTFYLGHKTFTASIARKGS